MTHLDLSARELGFRLDLGDLNARPTCHGYACGDRCEECRARSGQVSPAFRRWLNGQDDDVRVPAVFSRQSKPQPWEPRRAA